MAQEAVPTSSCQDILPCKLCTKPKRLEWLCFDCTALMCDDCRQVHANIKTDTFHKIIDIRNVEQHDILCPKHSLQCLLFCDKCEIPVCKNCIAVVHQGEVHPLTEVNKALKKRLKEMKKEQPSIEEKISGLRRKREEMRTNFSEVRQQISKHETHLKKAIEKCVRRLIRDINDNSDAMLSDNDISQLELYKTQFANKIRQLEKFTSDNKIFFDNEFDIFIKDNFPMNSSENLNLLKFVPREKTMEEMGELVGSLSNFQSDIELPSTFRRHLGSGMPPFAEKLETVPENESRMPGARKVSGDQTNKETETLSKLKSTGPGKGSESQVPISRDNKVLKVKSEYQTDLSVVTFCCASSNNTVWIAGGLDDVLHQVKLENSLRTFFNMDVSVFGMTVMESGDLLLLTVDCCIKKVNMENGKDHGKIFDSPFNLAPFYPTAIHEMKKNMVIIGAGQTDLEKATVKIMNEKGITSKELDCDKNGQSYFTFPSSITSTSNGNIFIADFKPGALSGKVLVFAKNYNLLKTYTGYKDINKYTPFKPNDIETTPRDHVVITGSNILHVLDNAGEFVKYINTREVGIFFPYSLSFSRTGKLYIGCSRPVGNKSREAKLYEVEWNE